MSNPSVVSSHSGADEFDCEKVDFRDVCSRSGPTYSFWGKKERTQRSCDGEEVKLGPWTKRETSVVLAKESGYIFYWESAVLGRHKVPDFWENAAKLLSNPNFGPGHTLGERFSQIEEQLAAKWDMYSQRTLPHHGPTLLTECTFHEPETATSHPDSEGSHTNTERSKSRRLRTIVTRLLSPRRPGRLVDTQGQSAGSAAGADNGSE